MKHHLAESLINKTWEFLDSIMKDSAAVDDDDMGFGPTWVLPTKRLAP